MMNSPDTISHSSRSDYFSQVMLILIQMRHNRPSGRLSLRNGDRFGLAHLYFKEGLLVHVTGDKGDGEEVLNDVITWSKGYARFDQEKIMNYVNITWQQTEIFTQWLSLLEMRAIAHGIPRSQITGLTQHLTVALPKKPIAMPQVVDRTFSEEQREQFHVLSQSTAERMGEIMQRAGRVTQSIKRRAAKATQEGIRQATEIAQFTAKQVGLHNDSDELLS